MGEPDSVAIDGSESRMTEHEKKNRARRLIEVTTLSPQESEVFARKREEDTSELADRLGIEPETVESIKYGRIPKKLREAENTMAECEFRWSWSNPENPESDPQAYALVGCSGPECEQQSNPNVQTATTNPNFNDFYTKTINTHDTPIHITNKVELVFCSLECLNDFENEEQDL